MSLEVRPKIPYRKHLPDFTKYYANTPEDIAKIASKVAKLYRFFLTPAAHSDNNPLCDKLRKKGVMLLVDRSHCSSRKELDAFEQTLKSQIITILSPGSLQEPEILLKTDYEPISQILQDAVKALVDSSNYEGLFPGKASLLITVQGDIICVKGNFAAFGEWDFTK